MNIFNLSFGKDSMATLLLALEKGIKIDHVMYCDIRFTPQISGEHPLMADWIPTAEAELKQRYGIIVEHAYNISYVEQFYKIKNKGKHIGDIYGFPHVIGAWCNSRLKLAAISKYLRQYRNDTIIQFVGIAVDERKRFDRLLAKETKHINYRSLLIENGYTEVDALTKCREHGLLSPIYTAPGDQASFRGGCWFCPKQSKKNLYALWKYYPELFELLKELEKHSHTTFRPGKTVEELEKEFKLL